MSTKPPNRPLADAMRQAGVSNKGLASRVRTLATAHGYDIAPDHVSVRRWLDGVRPHDRTATLVAEALSIKLGHHVTLDDLGFDCGDDEAHLVSVAVQYPDSAERAVSLIDAVAAADLAGSDAVGATTWTPGAAPAVITSYLFGHTDLADKGAGTGSAAEIRATTRALMDLDFRFGGGHVRKLLLYYYTSEAVPLLRASRPGPQTFSAVADTVQLMGWSAYDAGLHGAAQRYLVQGLRLASEADDRMLGARMLASLSHQANFLGRYADALQLSRAAQSAAGAASPAVEAMMLAMEARALASLGESTGVAQVLTRAEKALARRTTGGDPDWIAYFDDVELAGEAAHCFRDLGDAGRTREFAAQAIAPHMSPRTRSFIDMVTAGGALNAGELEEAVHLASQAVQAAGALQSRRYLRYVADFRAAITARFADTPEAEDFRRILARHHPTLDSSEGSTGAAA